MKNKFVLHYLTYFLSLIGLLMIVPSCQEDDPEPWLFAHFDYTISDSNPFEVSFINYSKNAISYSWDFGDSGSSTDANPIHEYDTFGKYTVILTASNASGDFDEKIIEIEIGDPDTELKKLTSETSKKWILMREGVALGIYSPEGGAWWEFAGSGLSERPCVLDDEITFNFDGTVTVDTKNTVYLDGEADGGWNDALGAGCHDESEADLWKAADGTDVSDFANGVSGTFTYDAASKILTVTGSGFYIGLTSKTNNGDNAFPIDTKTYEVTNFEEGDGFDKMQLTMWLGDGASWKFNLISYDDFSQAPEIPMPPTTGITDFVIDHETDVTWELFGGSTVEIIDNPDKTGINISDKVLKLTHGDQTWAGIVTELGGLLDFTGKTKLKVKLWAPAAGTLKYKLEAGGGNPSQEIDLSVATANEWVELEWDLSTDINGNPVESDKYSRLVLFPGWDTTSADVYYVDDITME
jgi:PKD repeat protein